MFSRFRMNLIVEIQGLDWDWLRLIAASGIAQCKQWKVGRERKTESLSCSSYRHTVQDHRQLLLLDSASSLWTKKSSTHRGNLMETVFSFKRLYKVSLARTICVGVGHFFVCHHPCCCVVHLFGAVKHILWSRVFTTRRKHPGGATSKQRTKRNIP